MATTSDKHSPDDPHPFDVFADQSDARQPDWARWVRSAGHVLYLKTHAIREAADFAYRNSGAAEEVAEELMKRAELDRQVQEYLRLAEEQASEYRECKAMAEADSDSHWSRQRWKIRALKQAVAFRMWENAENDRERRDMELEARYSVAREADELAHRRRQAELKAEAEAMAAEIKRMAEWQDAEIKRCAELERQLQAAEREAERKKKEEDEKRAAAAKEELRLSRLKLLQYLEQKMMHEEDVLVRAIMAEEQWQREAAARRAAKEAQKTLQWERRARQAMAEEDKLMRLVMEHEARVAAEEAARQSHKDAQAATARAVFDKMASDRRFKVPSADELRWADDTDAAPPSLEALLGGMLSD